MARLNILHILWSAGIGGIEKLVFDLARSQQKNAGLNVEVLVCKGSGKYVEFFVNENIPCHQLDMKNALDFSPAKAKKVKNLFSRCDVLHIHSFNPWIAWMAGTSGKKIVYTEHGNFAIGRKKSFSEEINAKLQKKFLNSKVHLISFNSVFTDHTARKKYGLQKVKTAVVPNGIDFHNHQLPDEKLLPAAFREFIQRKFVIGTCSRFVAVKKIDRLIRAFAKFSSTHENAVLVLCGDGPEKNSYLDLARQLSIEKKVLITGFNEQTSTWQHLMNISVYPSNGEAFGLAAVESLYEGSHVIVFADGGGLAEIIGRISKDDVVKDEDGLLARMEYYFANAETTEARERRTDEARKYDIITMEKTFYQFYKTLSG